MRHLALLFAVLTLAACQSPAPTPVAATKPESRGLASTKNECVRKMADIVQSEPGIHRNYKSCALMDQTKMIRKLKGGSSIAIAPTLYGTGVSAEIFVRGLGDGPFGLQSPPMALTDGIQTPSSFMGNDVNVSCGENGSIISDAKGMYHYEVAITRENMAISFKDYRNSSSSYQISCRY